MADDKKDKGINVFFPMEDKEMHPLLRQCLDNYFKPNAKNMVNRKSRPSVQPTDPPAGPDVREMPPETVDGL